MTVRDLLPVASWVALCRAKLATRFPFHLPSQSDRRRLPALEGLGGISPEHSEVFCQLSTLAVVDRFAGYRTFRKPRNRPTRK
jgi:hypothetical protein